MLTCKREQKFILDFSCATMFRIFAKIYDEVYESMVKCGVELIFPKHTHIYKYINIYMDRDGKDMTTNKKNAFGFLMHA